MFRFFKTLFFWGVVKKIKNRVFIIIASLILMAVSNSFFDDILSITNDSPYFILSVKWAVLLTLIVVITYQVKKIISINYLSIKKDEVLNNYNGDGDGDETFSKKHKVLQKDKLTSRSDTIIEKYKRK